MSSEKIVIIGAGTFGLSTGLHLLRKGCKDVTLIDPYPVPSPISAGNDVNKIMQSNSMHPFYGVLALEALESWRTDKTFKPAFHETGIVYAAKNGDELIDSKKFKEANGLKCKNISEEELKKLIPDTQDGNAARFEGWNAFYQTDGCGWTFAKQALELAAEEIIALGGKFVVGDAQEILYGKSSEVTGVKCADGTTVECDKCVLAAGAQSYKFLDFEGQLLAKCWTVGHIRLDEEERKRLKGIPVLLSYDHGFLFEPDSIGDLKFCNEFPGYINRPDGADSIPLYKDAVPQEAEDYMRAFLKEVFPHLAEREFSVAKICWCTDTADRDFLIGTHPDHKGLILGTGDSGQGFKFMPIIGKYISTVVMEGDEALGEEKQSRWKWRPESGKKRDIFDLQKRSGGTDLIKDLNDVKSWTDGKLTGITKKLESL